MSIKRDISAMPSRIDGSTRALRSALNKPKKHRLHSHQSDKIVYDLTSKKFNQIINRKLNNKNTDMPSGMKLPQYTTVCIQSLLTTDMQMKNGHAQHAHMIIQAG